MLMNNTIYFGNVSSMKMQTDEECHVWIGSVSGKPAAVRKMDLVFDDGTKGKIGFHLCDEEAVRLWNLKQAKAVEA